MRHSYIFLFLCCWEIKLIFSQREVDERERDRKEINDIFKRMRRAYESGDHNSIKPNTWGFISKNDDAKVWNKNKYLSLNSLDGIRIELEAVPFIYNIDSNPYSEEEPKPLMNDVNENNDILVDKPNKFISSSQKIPKNFDLFDDEYETDDVDVPDSLLDVMKNEEFWTWLQSWTATYMELLLERIHESVVDEVDKQLKIRLNTQNVPSTTETVDKPLSITYEESEDIDINNNKADDDDDSYTYDDDYEYPENEEDDKESEAEEVGDEGEEREGEKESDVLEEKYPEIDERIKETDEVRAKRNNVEVKSGQIYGNSLNTDKVTNVFIFLQKPEDIFSVIRPFIGDKEVISVENETHTDELNEVTNDDVTEETVTEEKVTVSETKETEPVTEEIIENIIEDLTKIVIEPDEEMVSEKL